MGIAIIEGEYDYEKIQVSMEMLDRMRKQIYIYTIGNDVFSVGLE